METIKKAFPAHSESSIRKRLKPCAEFHRTGPDSNWWVLKSGFRLPTEDEIRSMVEPEQCVAYYSMAAAEQRLKDSGYGDKFIMAQEEDDNEDLKMDDEIKCAPWHTTRAYVQAIKGRCLLQLTGPADPTGPAQEGFSYVKIPIKPTHKEEQETQPKRTVNGTDADLRKLSLKDAKDILRNNGVPEDEIKKLSRWEVIDVVRTLSTERVKAGEEGADSFKFSRGNRFSVAEHQERYREDCQRIFEVQNKVLASDEILSSDDGESSTEEEECDEDLVELGKNIENMLANKKTSNQIQREREELERRQLRKVMMENSRDKENIKSEDLTLEENQVLRITRIFKNSSGEEFTRTELVRKPSVIETYVKVRNTKDESFIRQFATMDDEVKEEMKKEKRRIQEQLRRIKRNQEKTRLGIQRKYKKRKEKPKIDLKLKCGACGQVGHMKTNKACPKVTDDSEFEGLGLEMGSRNESVTLEEHERMEMKMENHNSDESLVNVDGTKVKFSEKIMKQADGMKRKSVKQIIPDELFKLGTRNTGTGRHYDNLANKTLKPMERRRNDPVITFSSYLQSILNELKAMPEVGPFLFPVKPESNYLDVIKHPMDLQTVREKTLQHKYTNREEFLFDINQIVENSSKFNGEASELTKKSKLLLNHVVRAFTQSEARLINLEKMINPLLDDNDQNALSYILDNILKEKIMSMNESWPFTKPVNQQLFKDYYEKIKCPMDLETMTKNIQYHKYHSRQEFINDLQLIYRNSRAFNGENSELTKNARVLVDTARDTLADFAEHCKILEINIREAQKRSKEQTEIDLLSNISTGELDITDKKDEKYDISTENMGSDKSFRDGDNSYLMDDLQESSEEEDEEWDEVKDSTEQQGFIINIGQNTLAEEPVLMTIKQEPVQDYFSETTVESLGPMFDMRTESNEEIVPNKDQSLRKGESSCSPSVYPGNPQEEQVDENYDPSDFLQDLLPGDTVTPNLDFLKEDLAVSDDSDDEVEQKFKDDPMAF